MAVSYLSNDQCKISSLFCCNAVANALTLQIGSIHLNALVKIVEHIDYYIMKFNHTRSYLFALLTAALLFTACGSDDPEPVNEEELITTVRVTFTGTGPNEGETVVATFKDLDGAGGNAPEITNPVVLSANGAYDVSVEFLNETETPAEDITEEVEEEDEEHQVFVLPSNGLNFIYTYNDKDDNDQPLGLAGSVTTGNASTGTLQILLIHEPNKSATGVSAGDPTNAGGETDISVTFNLNIQ